MNTPSPVEWSLFGFDFNTFRQKYQAMIAQACNPWTAELTYGDFQEPLNALRATESFEQVLALWEGLTEKQRNFFGRTVWSWMGHRRKTNPSDPQFLSDMVLFKAIATRSWHAVHQKSNRGFLNNSGAYGKDYLGTSPEKAAA